MDYVLRTWTSPDGLTLSGRDYAAAEGPARLPVVCLHGLTRNTRDFERVAPQLAASGRRVLALDVRGRGRSAYAADPMLYVVPTYVEDVIGWARALGVARAVFVGTSMGGLIIMALAVTRPSLVAAAVLNDIGGRIAAPGLARIAAYAARPPPQVRDWNAAAAYARHINAAAFPAYGDAEWAAFARRLFREEAGAPVLDYDPAIGEPIKAAAGQPQPDLWPSFDTLAEGRPLLLVRGALSDLTPSEIAAEMHARAPDMAIAEVPDVGHAPMLDEPVAAAALDAFLASVD